MIRVAVWIASARQNRQRLPCHRESYRHSSTRWQYSTATKVSSDFPKCSRGAWCQNFTFFQVRYLQLSSIKATLRTFGLHDSGDSVLISWHVKIPAIIQPLNWKKQLLKAIILQYVVVTRRQTLWDCSVSQTVPTLSGTSFEVYLSRQQGLIGDCSFNFPLLDMWTLMATQYLAYVHTCDIQMCVCVFI